MRVIGDLNFSCAIRLTGVGSWDLAPRLYGAPPHRFLKDRLNRVSFV